LKAARTPTAGEQPRVSPNMKSRGTPSNSSNNSHPSPLGSQNSSNRGAGIRPNDTHDHLRIERDQEILS